MINKSSIILPGDTDEIKLCLSRACDLYTKSLFSGRCLFTKFLTPLEAHEIEMRFPKGEVVVDFFGGFDGAERRVACFDASQSSPVYPVCIVRIALKGKQTLSHRDYLGSILSLGLKRELLGDILVDSEGATLFCLDEIADYIVDNLTKIANSGVKAKRVDADSQEFDFKRNYESFSSTVSSLRLDAVVASAVSKSRATASELIGRGLVSLNYKEALSASASIKDGDVITVRGFGKFLINTDERLTRKGRIHIDINKYA